MIFCIFKNPAVVAFRHCIPVFSMDAFRLFYSFRHRVAGMAWYRMLFIRNCEYLITMEYVRLSRGIFFKRVDQVKCTALRITLLHNLSYFKYSG